CRCKKSIKKFSNCLLLTESGFFEKNSLRKSLFENYINDVIFLCKKFKLNCVHYKLHPRSRGKWHIKFIDQLRKNNLKIELLDQKNFINKIACDYPVIASALSGSLKIARRSCNKIKVVGLINQSIPAHGNLNYRQLLDNNGIEWLEDPKKFNTSNTKKTFYKNKKRKILTDYIK
ncbi:hypothetical protein N9B70_06135, partial [Candidatus Pelagibacter sp.]|nr:hypothetical protein [Candidatus Pelagibacter sp.]